MGLVEGSADRILAHGRSRIGDTRSAVPDVWRRDGENGQYEEEAELEDLGDFHGRWSSNLRLVWIWKNVLRAMGQAGVLCMNDWRSGVVESGQEGTEIATGSCIMYTVGSTVAHIRDGHHPPPPTLQAM